MTLVRMKRVVLCLSHSIEEYQQLQLLTEAGYEVFSIGGYIDPAAPHDPKRPPLPDVPHYPELQAVVDALDTPDNLGAAQSHIPGPILDWLGDDGIIIFHHLLDRLWGQWRHLRQDFKGRVVWRSVGQTDPQVERTAAYYRAQGLERVAYSPREEHIPGHAGYDALIRFYVDPDEWQGWTGEDAHVINITQRLFQRGQATNPSFWLEATKGLPAIPVGEGSDAHRGPGILPFDEMKQALRSARAYLYTGTRPASYTLGFIEAMMTGIPIVSIGPDAWGEGIEWMPGVFEAHEFASSYHDDAERARMFLRDFLDAHDEAAIASKHQRQRAIDTFGKAKVMADWQAFLG